MTAPVLPAPNPSRSQQLGALLVRLGGADSAILAMARDTGRARFAQMGLVLLSTAGLAVLSMSFALTTGLHLVWPVAILVGLVWGFIILNLDRMLVLNLDMRGGLLRVAAAVLPRVFIAALLGIVISTPLVLQVFQVEIQEQIAETQTLNETTLGANLDKTASATALAQVQKQIQTDEAILDGDMPPSGTTTVQQQAQILKDAEAKQSDLRDKAEQKYRAWQCELYGSSCESSTNVPGNGNLAKARGQEYQAAKAQADAADQDVATAKAALDKARDDAKVTDATSLQAAQAQAQKELPDLRKREADLQAQVNDRLDDRAGKIAANDGLLAQIVALSDLSADKPDARITHIAVGLLFFMIELLPVLVKIITGMGAPSLYDRIREKVENQRFDDADAELRVLARERDEADDRRVAAALKNRDIEDDMRDRERDLALKANARVAEEMQGVLEVALSDWAQDVQQTLHRQKVAPPSGFAPTGGPAPNSGAPAGPTVAVPAQAHVGAAPDSGGVSATVPVQAVVVSRFPLPDGNKL